MNPITNSIKGLHPAYFAMVMSTGIISIASKLLGFTGIAYGLFYINIIAYAIILPFQIVRVFAYWENLYKDLCNPKLSLVIFHHGRCHKCTGRTIYHYSKPTWSSKNFLVFWYLSLARCFVSLIQRTFHQVWGRAWISNTRRLAHICRGNTFRCSSWCSAFN